MRSIHWIAVALLFASCSPAPSESKTLTLATTTSTRDSGLLDTLLPLFKAQTGIEVKVVAVGSGQAIELGRRGDADVLLTHAPAMEEQFVADGHAAERRGVMYNDFVIVGPQADPAGMQGQTSAVAAVRLAAQSQSPFISRDDNSGTHMKEQQIWQEAGIEPQGEWYLQAGSGMAEALRMASEKRGYILTDRGTYLALRDQLELTIHSEGDPLLQNPYSIMVVSSQKHPTVNSAAAERFAEFLLSAEIQHAIGQFGLEQYGQPLFFPNSAGN